MFSLVSVIPIIKRSLIFVIFIVIRELLLVQLKISFQNIKLNLVFIVDSYLSLTSGFRVKECEFIIVSFVMITFNHYYYI